MDKAKKIEFMQGKSFVVIRDCSEGNEFVGEMWQETKVFEASATLAEAMAWAEGDYLGECSSRRISITRAHEPVPMSDPDF